MIKINICPAVCVRQCPIKLHMDGAQLGHVVVGLVGNVRVIDQVVKLGQTKITTQHDLPALGIQAAADLVQPVGRMGTGKGLEDVGGCVARVIPHPRAVFDRPHLVVA